MTSDERKHNWISHNITGTISDIIEFGKSKLEYLNGEKRSYGEWKVKIIEDGVIETISSNKDTWLCYTEETVPSHILNDIGGSNLKFIKLLQESFQ